MEASETSSLSQAPERPCGSPPPGAGYVTLEQAWEAIQAHASINGYRMVKNDTKPGRARFRCAKGRDYKLKATRKPTNLSDGRLVHSSAAASSSRPFGVSVTAGGLLSFLTAQEHYTTTAGAIQLPLLPLDPMHLLPSMKKSLS